MDTHPELALPIAILGLTFALALLIFVLWQLLRFDADRRRARWAARRARVEAERTRRFAEYLTENHLWPTRPVPVETIQRAAAELEVETDRFARDFKLAHDKLLRVGR